MPPLLSLVYVSTARSRLRETELEHLLSLCRERNQQNAVTGVLLYSDGNFMQYLEGPDTSVRQTYQRICVDPLHGNLVELLLEPINERVFSTWAMGFAQPTVSMLLALSNARWKHMGVDTSASADAPPGMQLLRNFWQTANR
ncbi:MAG: BLUF domain-containing protein [Rhodoferax sp.]|uniref:BLUF domain-containing protein n=1 Tax=Rhodoferax sp. TaxID=50421 RepID=UPI003263D42B